MKRVLPCLTTALLALELAAAGADGKQSVFSAAQDPGAQHARAALQQLPLRFEQNAGQTDKSVRYFTRGDEYVLYLTGNEAVIALNGVNTEAKVSDPRPPSRIEHDSAAATVVRARFMGASESVQIEGVEELEAKSNYFAARRDQLTGISAYSKVAYRQIYPGVDLLFYGKGRELEYDFRLSPGADPHRIQIAFEGAEHLELNKEGDLVLRRERGPAATPSRGLPG